jgi:hypothetical protein
MATNIDTNISIHSIDYKQPTIVRLINDMYWINTALYLDNNPDINDWPASHSHDNWTWRLARTNDIDIYIKNTYYNDILVCSEKMNKYITL